MPLVLFDIHDKRVIRFSPRKIVRFVDSFLIMICMQQSEIETANNHEFVFFTVRRYVVNALYSVSSRCHIDKNVVTFFQKTSQRFYRYFCKKVVKNSPLASLHNLTERNHPRSSEALCT
jgi:hypothetical protein